MLESNPISPLDKKRALNKLCKNTDRVINKADKGSTIVIQNRIDYINEAMTHLSDTTTYKPLTGGPTHICKQINTILYEYYICNDDEPDLEVLTVVCYLTAEYTMSYPCMQYVVQNHHPRIMFSFALIVYTKAFASQLL